VATGRIVAPAEILIEDERIKAVGSAVEHAGVARVIDLGDVTLLPGLIDAHVHLFLHPGSESLQTVEESVPQRTILAMLAARDDLLAGFTAERDMGTEARDRRIPRCAMPLTRVSLSGRVFGSAATPSTFWVATRMPIHFNPAQHVLSNATYANDVDELVAAIRQQHKEGSDFVKIYETGPDRMRDGVLRTPYQYTAAQLRAAVDEASRLGTTVGVHAMGEPGALYAAQAGVASIDHASQLSIETMTLMKQKHIPAVPTFAVFEYFANHGEAADMQRESALLAYKVLQFKKQIAAGIPFAVGSDVGPFRTEPRHASLSYSSNMA